MTQTETLGKRLARHRKAAGMSAQGLADRVGVTRAVINNLELGRREDMTVGQLVQISDALGVPAAALAADVFHPFQPSGYGDLTNWDVVRLLSKDHAEDWGDIIWQTELLLEVVERWGELANSYIDRAAVARASGDPRDATLATYERQTLERSLQRGKDMYERLDKLGVDVSWARGDWMTYEIPTDGFDSEAP